MEWNYLDAYIEETGEQLSRLEQLLLKLEKKPEQQDILNEIFRVVHTLKGSSATMGFGEVADFSHKMENLFEKLRKGEMEINDELVDIFFECLDALKEMTTAAIKGEAYNGNVNELTEIINSLIHTGSSGKIKNQGENTKWRVSVRINSDCTMKTARALVIEKYIEEMGNILSIDPPVDILIGEKLECEEISAVIEIQGDIEDVVLGLKNIPDVESVKIRQATENFGSVIIDLSVTHKPEDLKRLRKALIRADEVRLVFGERCKINLALLQLVLAAHRENKLVRCERGGGPALKMLKLMGVL
ncbi:Hpt domain-containing protein [Thermoanaerobacterium sp. DL9XJH110]|uniref:Hpt domain-containing protein n=1 Tax=Thermoanaerobacterium sp. DL9XJH110 TaxID=3386643 RepID=UPI003BB63A45